MTQTAPVCLNHCLQPWCTGYWWHGSHRGLCFTEIGQGDCLHHVYVPIIIYIHSPAWVWFLNALFQHLGPCPGVKPQTETTINSSTQNTFLKIHQPKSWGLFDHRDQIDPTWAACLDLLHRSFFGVYTEGMRAACSRTTRLWAIMGSAMWKGWWVDMLSSASQLFIIRPRGSLHPMTLLFCYIYSTSICDGFQELFCHDVFSF